MSEELENFYNKISCCEADKIYEFIWNTIKEENVIIDSYVINDFFKDVLEVINSDKICSTFLEFRDFTIIVDNIDKINYYKL